MKSIPSWFIKVFDILPHDAVPSSRVAAAFPPLPVSVLVGNGYQQYIAPARIPSFFYYIEAFRFREGVQYACLVHPRIVERPPGILLNGIRHARMEGVY
jgi:hypothetical protein